MVSGNRVIRGQSATATPTRCIISECRDPGGTSTIVCCCHHCRRPARLAVSGSKQRSSHPGSAHHVACGPWNMIHQRIGKPGSRCHLHITSKAAEAEAAGQECKKPVACAAVVQCVHDHVASTRNRTSWQNVKEHQQHLRTRNHDLASAKCGTAFRVRSLKTINKSPAVSPHPPQHRPVRADISSNSQLQYKTDKTQNTEQHKWLNDDRQPRTIIAWRQCYRKAILSVLPQSNIAIKRHRSAN